MSSALSWKPYGVSRTTAGASPTRSKIARCGLTIVGAVSPEPMMTSSRVISRPFARRVERADIVIQPGGQREQVVGDPPGLLGVQIVIAAHVLADPGVGQRGGRPQTRSRRTAAASGSSGSAGISSTGTATRG